MTDRRLPPARLRAPSRAAQDSDSRKLPWPACPQCSAALDRIPRRWTDRLLSLVTPLRRYRCRSIVCAWEGNLRRGRTGQPGEAGERQYEHRIDGP